MTIGSWQNDSTFHHLVNRISSLSGAQQNREFSNVLQGSFLYEQGNYRSNKLWGVLIDHPFPAGSGLRFELTFDRRDFRKRRQARLIAKMLDLMGGCRLCEPEMLFPTLV
jgi:hypothetical protein